MQERKNSKFLENISLNEKINSLNAKGYFVVKISYMVEITLRSLYHHFNEGLGANKIK